MKYKMCPGKCKTIFIPFYGNKIGVYFGGFPVSYHEFYNIKRIIMKCELCGRKLWSSISNTEDGDLIHSIPPHKIKHWWKRKNKIK